LRQITKGEFIGLWEKGYLFDIVQVEKWLLARKNAHSGPTDTNPVEIVYVVLP